MEICEKDWQIFKRKIPLWQENYIKKLNAEYVDILNSDISPSVCFWKLEKRIKSDSRKAGVIVDLSRKNMISTIIELINDKVICEADLIEFSNQLKETISSFF